VICLSLSHGTKSGEIPVATADFTIADVLAWARTKPADERYNYVDPHNCAISQFLRDTGRAVTPVVNQMSWWDEEDGEPQTYPWEISSAANQGSDDFGTFVANLESLSA
jgi:hypothetical protein